MTDHSELIDVGQILGPHGVDGAVKIKSFTDVPTRFSPGNVLFIHNKSHEIIDSFPLRKDQLVLRLSGLQSARQVEDLTGEWVRSSWRSSPALDQNEFFHYQLIGLNVYTENGDELGSIKEIIQTGSNDVYLVDCEGQELLLPAISQVIREINLEDGKMIVNLIEGLR